MIREKLIEAREKRGWTQPELAERCEVDVATIRRWEHGEVSPQGKNKWKLMAVFGVSSEDELGLIENIRVSSEPMSEADLVEAEQMDNLLDTFVIKTNTLQMLDLVSATRCASHREIQILRHRVIEAFMQKDTLSRREAVRFLAMAPIALYKLSAFGASSSRHIEDILIKCAAGITACEQLGKGSAEDIAIAFSSLSAYLPTLMAIVKESSEHRKEAAKQVAQCLFLKATLSMHKEGPKRASFYMEQAAIYGEESKSVSLQLGILKRLAWIHACDKQRHPALEKMLEAQSKLKKTKAPVDALVQCRHYVGVAEYQALNGHYDDALIALGEAHNAYPGNENNSDIDFNFSGLMLETGMTHYYAGRYTEAFASFSQVIDPETLAPKTDLSSERIRCEVINYETLASLKLPQKDMPLSIKLWTTGMQSAIALRSEQRFNEALTAYDIMEALWPGEKRIVDLRQHLVHW